MANYNTLKATIADAIKQNSNNEITGNLLQQQLLAMVNSLGVGFQYMGIAIPSTNPGTPDQRLFYIAIEPGVYSNFGGAVIEVGQIGVFVYNGSWANSVGTIVEIINDLSTGGADSALSAEQGVLLYQQITQIQKNIGFDVVLSYGDDIFADFSLGILLVSDGTTIPSGAAQTSDYIPIKNGIKFTTRLPGATEYASYCLYDENKNFVRSVRIDAAVGVNTEIELPASVGYVRWVKANNPYVDTYKTIIGTLSDSIKSIKNDIDFSGIMELKQKREYDTIVGLLKTDGTVDTSLASRRVSDYIAFDADIIVYNAFQATSSAYAQICVYDENKNFVRAINGTSGQISNVSMVKDSYPSGKYIRYSLSSQNDLCAAKILEPVGTYIDEEIKRAVGLPLFRGNVRFSTEAGLLNRDGSIASSASRRVSDYIPFDADVIVFNAFQGTNLDYAQVCIYDKDKNCIGFINGSAGETANVTLRKANYESGKFIRYTLPSLSTLCFAEIELPIKEYVDRYSISQNFGKKIAIFGGSFATSGSPYFTDAALNIWRDKLGVQITDYAVGGAGFTPQASSLIRTQVDAACADDVEPYDIYILWASGNDFSGRGAIGNQSDYTDEDNFDPEKLSTQCGAINYCVKKIIEKAPTAKICLFTSLRYVDREPGWNPFSNADVTLAQYVDGQKSCCKRWGIPVLDQFMEIAWNPYNAAIMASNDGVHPSETGYKYIAQRQVSFLEKL